MLFSSALFSRRKDLPEHNTGIKLLDHNYNLVNADVILLYMLNQASC